MKNNQVNTATEDYEVERIVGSRIVNGVTWYRVHWAGYESADDSWLPTDRLDNCQDAIEEYENSAI